MTVAKDADSKLQFLIRDIKDRLGKRRWLQERNWWGNILYHLGQQWVMYDQDARRWRQRRLSPSTPTPITNLFRATIDTIKSAIAQHEPRYLGVPLRDDARAVAAAAATDLHLQVLMREGRFETARRRMLDWLLLTGNGFIEATWDHSDETGLDAVPLEICADCMTANDPTKIDPANPVCDNCGSPFLVESTDQFMWAPRGEMRFGVLSPFEMYLDPAIDELEDQPFILVVQSFTQEQVHQIWGKEIEGGPGSEYAGTSVQHQLGIASIAPGASQHATTGDPADKRVVVYRLYCKYHKDMPKGGYVAMTSTGKLLEKKTPYPYKTRAGNGKNFYPLIHFRFGTVGGRAWGYTPADDLQPKQYQLNKAESLLTMIMARMANPVWLIPANTNPSRISGEIGVQIEYTPVGGAAPSRVPGSEAPQSLVKYIEDIRTSFDELSGAFAAVRGRSMGSRTPVGTVQSLQERGFGRWATVFQGLEEGYQDLAKKSLEVWRQNAKSPRILAIKNAVGAFTFQEFIGADWDDGVQVEVEAGSTRPHTQQEKMQSYVELAQIGVLDFMDEAQKVKMLEDLGMINMRPGVEEDQKDAFKENAKFMEWARQQAEQLQAIMDPEMQMMAAQQMAVTLPVRVVPIVDDHAVHFLTHRRLAQTDEFQALPEPIKAAWYMHMMQHQGDVMASKILKMAMQPQGQPGDGKAGAPPGGGSANQASEKQNAGGESNPDKNK